MKIPKLQISKSFSTRLSLWITLFTAILFVLAVTVLYGYTVHIIRKEAVGRCESELSKTTQNIDNILNTVEVTMNNMVWIVNKHKAEPDYMPKLTRRILENNPYILGSSIAFEPGYYKEKGHFYAPYAYRNGKTLENHQLGTEQYNYHYMDWYQIPKILGKACWSEPYVDFGETNVALTTYSIPLYDKGRMYAVLTADISLDWLTKTVNGIKVYPHSYNFLIGRSATFVAHPDTSRILSETIFTNVVAKGDSNAMLTGRKMIAGKTGVSQFKMQDGKPCYIFYTPIKTIGWSTAIVCPASDIFANVKTVGRIVMGVLAVGLLLLFFLCRYIVRHFCRPLEKFACAAESIAKGNFNTSLPQITTEDEMHRLGDSIDYMQHSLAKYMEELKSVTTNKERIESELRIAHQIQMGMIPKIFPPYPNRTDIDIYATLIPAKEVGGDLYDFFITDNKLRFIVGDVSGKGVPASLVMAVARSLFRTVAGNNDNPVEITQALNGAMTDNNDSNMFVTTFVGVLDLDTGRVDYCNAGHNAPVLVGPQNGQAAFIDCEANLPVGVMAGMEFKPQSTVIQRGTTILLYTDGLTEAENPQKELYGEERLLETLKAAGNPAPKEMISQVYAAVEAHVSGAQQSDDLTILAVKYQ